jgi:hypothetical protein
MADTYVQGIQDPLTTVVANITRDPDGAFLAALEPDLWPIRTQALANGLFTYEEGQLKVEWTEGALELSELNLNVEISSDATTTFDFGTTYIYAVRPNMLLRARNEIIRVVSVDTTAGTCEVTRGYNSSTPESSILTTDTVHILSVTPTRTETAGGGTAAYGGKVTNYVHYFEEDVELDDVSQTLATKTPEQQIAYQVNQKFLTIADRFGKSLFLATATGAAVTIRTMNGFRAQVPAANITSSVTALKFTHIDTIVSQLLTNGVVPDTMAVGPNVKVGLAQWSQARLKSVATVPADQAGGVTERFISAAGPQLRVVVDKSIPDYLTAGAEVFIYRASNLRAGSVPLLKQNVIEHPDAPSKVGVRVERLSRSGPFDHLQVCAYFTCQLLRPVGAGLLTGITSVDSDGV